MTMVKGFEEISEVEMMRIDRKGVETYVALAAIAQYKIRTIFQKNGKEFLITVKNVFKL